MSGPPLPLPLNCPPASEQPQPLPVLAGDVAIASNGWPEVVVWTPWTAMEACYRSGGGGTNTVLFNGSTEGCERFACCG